VITGFHKLIFFNGSSSPFRALASIILFTDGRTPWTSDQLVARPLPKHRTTQIQNKRIHTPHINALTGIRTHDPCVRASKDSSCLRPRGYCNQLHKLKSMQRKFSALYTTKIFSKYSVIKETY
jgi:hypothetical protein